MSNIKWIAENLQTFEDVLMKDGWIALGKSADRSFEVQCALNNLKSVVGQELAKEKQTDLVTYLQEHGHENIA